VLIVHDTGPAGYPWEVVRNSGTGSREELPPGDAYQLQIKVGSAMMPPPGCVQPPGRAWMN
jgi:hypothetical protein